MERYDGTEYLSGFINSQMKLKGGKWILAFAGAIIAVLLFRTFVFGSFLIPSSGMENALYQGDHILVNKWSYGLRMPFMQWFSYHRILEKPIAVGDFVVFNNPAQPQEKVWSNRKVFINRCVGIPGDTLLVDSFFHPIRTSQGVIPDEKLLYTYPPEKENAMDSLISVLSIAPNKLLGQSKKMHVRSFSRYEYYLLGQAISGTNWVRPLASNEDSHQLTYRLPIPRKGSVIKVTRWNAVLLRNTLVLHEGKQVDIKGDTLYINGKPTQHCYFTKDYYWMASNNSINLEDSRMFGFVPKDHVIGKASFIWFSKEKGKGLFKGYRWNRIFSAVR